MYPHIDAMLAEAYYRLGIRSVKDIDARIREARAYLKTARERYIEVAESDEAEYKITTTHGVICRQIPLAYEGTTREIGKRIRREVRMVSLIVSNTEARYICSRYRSQLRSDPADIVYTFPTSYFIRLEEIPSAMHVTAPQKIIPAATDAEWTAYCMVFHAMEKYCRHLPINVIPLKTEHALFYLDYLEPEELTVDGRKLTGKLLPLAQEDFLRDELRVDHTHSSRKELCLLVQEHGSQYILKALHIYQYFKKVILDDTPGGCIYEPTEEKQETVCTVTTLDALPPQMNTLY